MILAAVLIALIVVGALFLGVLPEFDRAKQLDTQIQDLDGQINTAKLLVSRRQSAKAQAAQTEVDLIKIANQVPESPELPSLIINLQDTANAAGLDFVQIAPAVPTAVVDQGGQPAGYTSIAIEVKVEGQWADMIDYISRLSKYTRGVRVKTAAFSSVAGTDAKDRYVEGRISLVVYTMSVINVNAPAVPSAPVTPPADAQPSQ